MTDPTSDPGGLAGVALELDCRDLRCPMPVIRLSQRIAEVAVGEVVGVLARDVAARSDVPAWCRMREHEYLGEDTASDGTPRYLVRRLH
jgi:tRNA 2-thiouridine synthesizing protein A